MYGFYLPDDPKYWPCNSADNTTALPIELNDLLEKVIADRIESTKNNIYALNTHLQRRTGLRDEFQREISEKMLRIQNLLYEKENIRDKNAVISLEGLLIELSKEKRSQDLSHWKDAVELSHVLRKLEKELYSALLDLLITRSLA